MKKTILTILMLCLTACGEDDQITEASLQRLIDCHTPKEGLVKEQACSALNNAEKRIYTCSTSRDLPPYCQTLSREESDLQIRFDMKKPFGELRLPKFGS